MSLSGSPMSHEEVGPTIWPRSMPNYFGNLNFQLSLREMGHKESVA